MGVERADERIGDVAGHGREGIGDVNADAAQLLEFRPQGGVTGLQFIDRFVEVGFEDAAMVHDRGPRLGELAAVDVLPGLVAIVRQELRQAALGQPELLPGQA